MLLKYLPLVSGALLRRKTRTAFTLRCLKRTLSPVP